MLVGDAGPRRRANATVPAQSYRLDGRSKVARAIKLERTKLLTALGSPADALTVSRVTELAELRVIAAEMRAKALMAAAVADTDKISKLHHTIERLSRQVGLNKPPQQKPPDLGEYLLQRREVRAASI